MLTLEEYKNNARQWLDNYLRRNNSSRFRSNLKIIKATLARQLIVQITHAYNWDKLYNIFVNAKQTNNIMVDKFNAQLFTIHRKYGSLDTYITDQITTCLNQTQGPTTLLRHRLESEQSSEQRLLQDWERKLHFPFLVNGTRFTILPGQQLTIDYIRHFLISKGITNPNLIDFLCRSAHQHGIFYFAKFIDAALIRTVSDNQNGFALRTSGTEEEMENSRNWSLTTINQDILKVEIQFNCDHILLLKDFTNIPLNPHLQIILTFNIKIIQTTFSMSAISVQCKNAEQLETYFRNTGITEPIEVFYEQGISDALADDLVAATGIHKI